MPKVVVVGCGYWGKNLVRNFAELNALHAVCDVNADLAAEFSGRFGVPALNLEQALAADCAGVAFASPAALHADHAGRALAAGKHVFVEKPLALTIDDGVKLHQLAKDADRVLMVGHLLQYHPLVLELLRQVRAGVVGDVRRVVSNRLSLGKIRTEEDVIWSFAPHDLSVILAVLGEMPIAISTHGTNMVTPGVTDAALLHLTFATGAAAEVNVSWLHPFKEQKLSIIGSEGHMVFDDTLPWDQKLTLLPHKVSVRNGWPEVTKAAPVAITVPQQEPLQQECAHFLSAMRDGHAPRTDATEALRVLAVLEAASLALKTGQAAVPRLG